MKTLKDKIKHSKELIENALNEYEEVAVASSFGKDSMVTLHLARSVNPEIPVFSIMTIYKPKETLEYLVEMDKKMNLNTTVYIVVDNTPEILKKIRLKLSCCQQKNLMKFFMM